MFFYTYLGNLKKISLVTVVMVIRVPSNGLHGNNVTEFYITIN